MQFDTDGSSVPAKYVTKGDTIEDEPTKTREGYRFEGWYKDGGTFQNAFNFGTDTIEADTTLYAKWHKKHTVEFQSGIVDVADKVVLDGDTVADPHVASTNAKYVLVGWYTDGDYAAAFDFSTPITKDTVVYGLDHRKNIKYVALHSKKVPDADDLKNCNPADREVFAFQKAGANVAARYFTLNGAGTKDVTSW